MKLTIQNDIGCIDSLTQYVEVVDNCYIAVPSAFTPNGDGKNESFKPDGFGLADNNIGYQMDVYDRWGQRLFESQFTTDVIFERIERELAQIATSSSLGFRPVPQPEVQL